ncbi:MAG: hypothetical protein JNM27_13485 [Leptospirales bacterium]|nr:hypothetical protein [Leptospirales bacterium]
MNRKIVPFFLLILSVLLVTGCPGKEKSPEMTQNTPEEVVSPADAQAQVDALLKEIEEL